MEETSSRRARNLFSSKETETQNNYLNLVHALPKIKGIYFLDEEDQAKLAEIDPMLPSNNQLSSIHLAQLRLAVTEEPITPVSSRTLSKPQ